jgi:hypothetical protein
VNENKDNQQHHHHALGELENIEVNEKNSSKSAWLTRSVIIVLCLFFFGGIGWGANDLLSRETAEAPPEELVQLAQQEEAIEADAPRTTSEMAESIEAALRYAEEEKPRLRLNRSFRLEGDDFDSVQFTSAATREPLEDGQAKRLLAGLKLLAPALVEKLDSGYPEEATAFGESFAALLWSIELREGDFKEAPACKYTAYQCSAYNCGNQADEPLEECPQCQAKNAYELIYLDDYTITLTFRDASPEALAAFHPQTAEQLAALLGDELDSFAELEAITPQLIRNATFTAVLHHGGDVSAPIQLRSLRFSYDLDVTATLKPQDEFASIGGLVVALTLGDSADFNFDWPSISLSEHAVSLEKRGGFALKVEMTAPEGAEFQWSSSDDAIVEIDPQGNVIARGELGQSAVITASFVLNGVTYEDSCLVNIRVSVEKVELNHRKRKLATGDTLQLKAKISPGDATVKDVRWYSRNEAIATVDENGLVTAIAAGSVEIYALAVDGNQKSTCKLTVEGGEA